jgi:hypothetical protein
MLYVVVIECLPPKKQVLEIVWPVATDKGVILLSHLCFYYTPLVSFNEDCVSPSFSDSFHILRLENNKTKIIDGQVRLVLLAWLIRLVLSAWLIGLVWSICKWISSLCFFINKWTNDKLLFVRWANGKSINEKCLGFCFLFETAV